MDHAKRGLFVRSLQLPKPIVIDIKLPLNLHARLSATRNWIQMKHTDRFREQF